MKKEYEDFIKEHGGLNFDLINFRPGAQTTCEFGLVERYKTIKGKTIWGYPGIHMGIDRGQYNSRGQTTRKIISPFTFERSSLLEDDPIYGTQTHFYHKFGFTLFIAHMYPKEIQIKETLQNKGIVEKDVYIGDAGSAGFSTGRHTHTEIQSDNRNCEFLEELLIEKYGNRVQENYTEKEIYDRYMAIATDQSEKEVGNIIKTWTKEQVLADYEEIRRSKNIIFLNDFKIIRNGKTYYSSKKLFDF